MENNAYVEIRGLQKFYPHKDGKIFRKPGEEKPLVKAVDGVNLSIQRGEILGVIGESGCGKSTLGRLLVRLEDPTSGDVLIDGVSTAQMLKKDPKHFRRQVQIVFQNPFETREEINIEGEPPTPINPGPGCYFAPRCYMATEECFQKYPESVDLGNGHYAVCSKVNCAACGKCNPSNSNA